MSQLFTQAPDLSPEMLELPEAYPLSFAQQRLWFLNQFDPANPFYNLSIALKGTGKLDLRALHCSLCEIVRRHETLRTNFVFSGGEPGQVISDDFDLTITLAEICDLPPGLREKEADRILTEDALRPFDLAHDRLLRVTLVKLAAEEHIAVITMHHIISDNWSKAVLIGEMTRLYEAYRTGQPPALPELPIQYIDYAVWQREYLQGEVLERQLSYWRKQLSGAPPLLELPTVRRRSAIQTHKGAAESFVVRSEIASTLRDVSKTEGVTLFMLLLAAFQLLLARYTGEEDIPVGTPIAGRTRVEVEPLIGFFVNTLVMRTNLSGNPTVRELIGRVREVCLSAYKHQDMPFDKLVEELQPERHLSYSPFFQIVFALQNTPQEQLQLSGLVLSDATPQHMIARFDLTLVMYEAGDELHGNLAYSTDLFDRKTAQQLVRHFQTLLREMVNGYPDQAISRVRLLEPADESEILRWSTTKQVHLSATCVCQLFEQKAQEQADSVAVVYGREQLTYAELNERANQLGWYLRGLGVGPEVRVGICVERSVELVVGVLGILKAGGAYVPMEVSYPAERLRYMSADAGVAVLLTQRQLAEQFGESGARVVCLEEEWSRIRECSRENVGGGSQPENLAYVIYTSGSSGLPKGVQITHRGLHNLVQWHLETYGVNGNDRLTQVASFGFDAAVWEIWPSLCGGAALHVCPEELRLDPAGLQQWLEREQITQSFLPTPLAEKVLELPGKGASSLRVLLTGGDKLQRWASEEQGFELVNHYGPTESTVVTSSAVVPESPLGNGGGPPIGKPISNTEVYVLDGEQELVPVGVSGELFIGGTSLARGYLGRAELTAEMFVPHRFSREAGARLYRTGDVVRYLADGNLEFVGRADNQVKIRGHRIELGEVEAVLSEHPHVSQAVVLVREDLLIAYVVGRDESESSAWREFLKQRLPDYMVPTAFVTMPALPLTENGKVDRNALPDPEPRVTLDSNAPLTSTEAILTVIWCEVLRVPHVGVHDNFFEAGGHSLQLTQIASRVRDQLRIELPLRQLFMFPTISELSRAIDTSNYEKQNLPGAISASRDEALPLSFAQQRLWFLNQLDAASAAYHIPLFLRLSGELNFREFERAFNEVVRRHEPLRTTFSVAGGEARQVIAPFEFSRIRLDDLSGLAETERELAVARLVNQQAEQLFDLANDPPIRVSMLRLRPQEHVLSAIIHHIAADGWSLGILVREVAAIYRAFVSQQPSPLSDLPIQYADFAVWQRNRLTGDLLDRQIEYWKQLFAGPPLTLDLATDRPRPPVQSFRGAQLPIAIPVELSRKLIALSRRRQTTTFMTLVAAFQTLLHRYTRQDEIVVGTPIANRNRSETEGLIGFFANTLVLRVDFSGNPSFVELLERVREVTLGAYAHQDVPFERLVEELQPARDLSRNPLFQVMFTLQNAPIEPLELPELRISAQEFETSSTRFDLECHFHEQGESFQGTLVYSTDLFDQSTIERLRSHFVRLLDSIVIHPEERIVALPLLSEGEKRQLLVEWNDTDAEVSRELRIHDLFEQQVERTPDSIALVFEGEHLSYLELNSRANRLAHSLQKLGITADSVVAVSMERSTDMFVSVLAVLKAGGAYLPLDPEYPAERLAIMFENSQTTVVLTQRSVAERFSEIDVRIICVDSDWDSIASELGCNPTSNATAGNLIYTLYTSGSTGRPKAIAMSHGSLVNLMHWQCLRSTPAHPLRTTQFASLTFDVSFQEIFSTWCTGGTLVLVSETTRRDSQALLSLLNREAVERLFVPFVALQSLAEISEREEIFPATLSQVITAGEQLKISGNIRQMFAQLPQCTLANHYGPTESHVITAFMLNGPANSWPDLPSIGGPIINVQLYLLDEMLQPVPIGAIGEVYVAGVAVARGYFNNAEVTAEQFIPNPFSANGNSRLYRTGDLGRYRNDGQVEFLGRRDHQVKVRGYRIEIGEIEVALRQQPAVREAVVVAHATASGEKRLIAYVVADAQARPSTSELRGFLRTKLPEYMIPAAFIFLEQFPLTLSGKVNRRALPAPEASLLELERLYVEPRTASEELVCGIWTRVLGVKEVGVEDNFFELGGHSLLATQVVSWIEEAFGRPLPLRTLFEAPTVRELAARIDAVTETVSSSLVRVSREQELPLSFAQQRLWFLAQLEPESCVYNLPLAVRLRGKLDVAALERTLNELLRRHEVLRTSFVEDQGKPRQEISAAVATALELVDLTALNGPEREEAEWLRAEARLPFDLRQSPLLRVKLLRFAEQEHVLLLTMHHIVSDGWSMAVLIREVSELYSAYASGREPELAELPIQYADYASWQREWLQGEVLEEQVQYWREQLAGAPQVLELPTDRVRPAVQSYAGGHERFELSEEVRAGLKELARREGVTLFMVLLAAFQVLLMRYSGQEDVVVGTPIAGRRHKEVEGLIGFFVNQLVLRTDLSGNPSFRELLKRVREVCLGAYSHQDLPFEKLVEELQPERALSHSPVFQVMLLLQNTAQPELQMGELRVEGVGAEGTTAKFDLVFALVEENERLSGVVEYDRSLYDAESIRRQITHWEVILKQVAKDAATRVGQLELLPEQERHELLVRARESGREYRSECLVELFEEQAQEHADSVAVVYGSEQLTYAELNERANQLGWYLRGLGVGPEVRVGICVERSVELVVGVLGILKAGGAYVPMEVSYPGERLRYMSADAGVAVLLTERQLAEQFGESGAARVVCLEEEWSRIRECPRENVGGGSQPENLAYVIYTSGSSGLPKGVAVEHASLTNYLCWVNETFFAGRSYSLPFVTSLSFDASLKQVFAPLIRGDQVWVLSTDTVSQPLELLAELDTRTSVALNCVPSLWASLLNSVPGSEIAERLKSLRCLFVGGEALSQELLDRTFTELPQLEVWNLYGPTEATANAVFSRIAPNKTPVIGRPVANATTYLLDARQQLLTTGMPGELFVGGAGVARGYLERPDLTAEKFLPDPFSGEAGARLYRTGDEVRYLADGNLEYLGRVDQQVKLRGYRIELGEVEAVLSEHPHVSQAVVVVREERLVAYVVTSGESESSAWREFLKQRLPDYMVPAMFVPLTALPLTANGKVDRRALPAPEIVQATAVEAARTPTEELLTGIWSEVLGRAETGVTENFFELGGHSLLATQLISRVREVFQIELPLRTLFEAPTIRELAARVEQALQAGTQSEVPPLQRVSREQPLPLSFAQQRLWFLEQLEPENPFYNAPLAVRLKGELRLDALTRTLRQLMTRHEVLRTSFVTDQGKPQQVIAPVEAVSLEVIELSELAETERDAAVRELAAREAAQPFVLSRGPLLRVKVLRLDPAEHVLLLTMHHIVSDGWSMGVLIREVSELYSAYASGREPELAELPIQYADYASWQREWLQGAVLEEQVQYWREQLAGAPQVLELPTDRVRPAVQSYRGGHERFVLDEAVSQGLRELSRREGVTQFMLLLAAFQVLLMRYSGQEDVVVGTDIAGRRHREVEGLIGFFINQLVLRTDLSGNPSFTELLKRVREVCLGAYSHQDLPFEKLVEELQPERDLSRSPLFQTKFLLQNEQREQIQLTGLETGSVAVEGGTAKYSLTLQIREVGSQAIGTLEYMSDLYDASSIRRFMGHFENVLSGIVADPEQRLRRLSLLSESEREQLLVEWNDTAVAYDASLCVPELFAAQVERSADAVALVFEDQQVTYEELNARANQLGRFLRRQGVGPDVCVGLCVERSLEMLVGVLGILKAGGAYVPLEPSYPEERLRFMVADAGVSIVLTQERHRERLGGSAARVVSLDQQWEEIAVEGRENFASGVSGENLVYVIYTSGSTGLPKGAMNRQAGLRNRLQWMQQAYQLTSADHVLQKTPYTFDVSVWELLWPLQTGARLVMAVPEGHRDREYLAAEIERQEVTVLHFVPSMLQAFVGAAEVGERCGSVRLIVSSGEALNAELQQEVQRRLGAELENLYGPTEAAIDVTAWRCERERGDGKVPIGKPISNTELYVLGGEQELVPVGVSGELYIGGTGLARGYLGRAELTAERFVPNPFSWEGGARLYRTGDVVRYLADGNLEYLGRADEQVKLKGYRIELGEVEAVLSEHPHVSQAVVIVREERLVAYVVTTGESESSEWREFLKQRLPEYMIPAVFVSLAALPLTANGKVDRRALPAPEWSRAGVKHEFVAPATEAERVLCEIWSELLGVKEVGVEDNFFELGGDSILSIQIVARAHQAGLRLTPRQMFTHQNVRELAAVAEVGAELVRGEQGEVTGAVVLTPIQQWFFEEELSGWEHYNQAVLLRVPELRAEWLQAALMGVVQQHDALRLRFARDGEGWRSWIAAVAEGAEAESFEYFDLRELSAEEQRRVVSETAERLQRSLQPETGPLLRVGYFALGGEEGGRLLVIIHHLAVDGVSWRILLEDLQRGYEQEERGERVALGAKSTSWREWGEQLQRYVAAGKLAEEEEYWLAAGNTLTGAEAERSRGRVGESEQVVTRLAAEETRELLQEVPRVYGTQITAVLLWGLVAALREWQGEQQQLVVEVEGHGREEMEGAAAVDLTRTVGWFTTLYPLALRVAEGVESSVGLQQVQEQVRAVPQRGMGYGLLKYLSGDEELRRRMRERARARVSFNYLGQIDNVVRTGTMYQAASEEIGAGRAPGAERSYELEVNGSVSGGELLVSWSYSSAVHQREEMEAIGERFVSALRQLLQECRAEQAQRSYSVADFPLAQLDQATLARIVGERRDIEDIYPLTPLQQGMLFHSLYEPEAGIGYEQVSCRLEGELDVTAFLRAWAAVVKRHTILRTAFVWEEVKEPLQVVRREVELPVRQEDWREMSASEQAERLREYLKEEQERGIDPGQAPLMRLSLLRLGEQSYQLVWSRHHLLLDGWSRPLLMKEVLSYYEAYRKGEELELAAVRPYREYIGWLQRQDQQAAEGYWREQLQDLQQATELVRSVGRVRAEVLGEERYTEVGRQLSAELSEALRRLCRAEKLTLNTVLQGAWAVLLSRYSGTREVVYGAVVAGRPAELAGVEQMVGLFINTLPVRVRVEGNERVTNWLRELQAAQVEMRQYEYSRLAQVQGWSGVNHGQRLFDTLFVFENFPIESPMQNDDGPLKISDYKFVLHDHYPFTISAGYMEKLSFQIDYDREYFADRTINKILDDFEITLRQIAAEPDAELSTLVAALAESDSERQKMDQQKLHSSGLQKLKSARRKSTRGPV